MAEDPLDCSLNVIVSVPQSGLGLVLGKAHRHDHGYHLLARCAHLLFGLTATGRSEGVIEVRVPHVVHHPGHRCLHTAIASVVDGPHTALPAEAHVHQLCNCSLINYPISPVVCTSSIFLRERDLMWLLASPSQRTQIKILRHLNLNIELDRLPRLIHTELEELNQEIIRESGQPYSFLSCGF